MSFRWPKKTSDNLTRVTMQLARKSNQKVSHRPKDRLRVTRTDGAGGCTKIPQSWHIARSEMDFISEFNRSVVVGQKYLR
jgi:hypothetical protein